MRPSLLQDLADRENGAATSRSGDGRGTSCLKPLSKHCGHACPPWRGCGGAKHYIGRPPACWGSGNVPQRPGPSTVGITQHVFLAEGVNPPWPSGASWAATRSQISICRRGIYFETSQRSKTHHTRTCWGHEGCLAERRLRGKGGSCCTVPRDCSESQESWCGEAGFHWS